MSALFIGLCTACGHKFFVFNRSIVMGFVELFLIGVGLSMDAFAVSVCKGLNMREKVNFKHAGIIALFFGGFQAIMPLIGYFLGIGFEKYITRIDHWIAFLLLGFIGGKMVVEAIKEWNETDKQEEDSLDIKELFILAVATSIDALAVGITFAFLNVGGIILVLMGVKILLEHLGIINF